MVRGSYNNNNRKFVKYIPKWRRNYLAKRKFNAMMRGFDRRKFNAYAGRVTPYWRGRV